MEEHSKPRIPGDPEERLSSVDVGDGGPAAVALAGVGARPAQVPRAEHPAGQPVRTVNLKHKTSSHK